MGKVKTRDPSISAVRATWAGSEDTREGKLCQKEGCLVCLAITANKWLEKKMMTTGKRINKMSHSLCPYAHQSALPGTFQVEAEDRKLPQEKRVSNFTGSLPKLQPISRAHLGIFQATPVGTIIPLWEKCNIWLVKLTITSTADNQGTTYVLIIPVRSRQPKILLELHCWISQKNLICAALWPLSPLPACLPLPIHRKQRAVVCAQGLLKLITSISVLCWSVTTLQRKQNPVEAWVTLPQWEGMDCS